MLDIYLFSLLKLYMYLFSNNINVYFSEMKIWKYMHEYEYDYISVYYLGTFSILL